MIHVIVQLVLSRRVQDMGVLRLQWSAQSPKVNPTEHFWDELERRLRIGKPRTECVAQLATFLQQEEAEFLKLCVKMMPKMLLM